MQVSVESTGSLSRKLTIQVPADQIADKIQSKLQSLTKTVSLKGFRPGKVPLKVIQTRYGNAIRGEVLQEMVQSSLQEALVAEKLEPVGGPQIQPKEFKTGEPFVYTAEFEVMPSIQLTPLDGAQIEKFAATVDAADVDKMIETFRTQRKTWDLVDREAIDGDRLMIDFEGKLDGVPFEGGKGNDVPLVLGSKSMIDGFEAQLLGAKSGDQKNLQLTFPADYPAAHLAGKPAEFDVRVISVAAPNLPEINEEFISSFGVTEGTLDALKKELLDNMERELKTNIRNKVKDAIMNLLAERNQVELPKTLVDKQIQQLVTQAREMSGKGRDINPELFRETAEKRVKLGLIIGEIIRSNEIRVDQERVRAHVEQLAKSYDEPEKVVQWYLTNRDARGNMEATVLEEQVVEWVLDNIQVNEVQSTFAELMKPL